MNVSVKTEIEDEYIKTEVDHSIESTVKTEIVEEGSEYTMIDGNCELIPKYEDIKAEIKTEERVTDFVSDDCDFIKSEATIKTEVTEEEPSPLDARGESGNKLGSVRYSVTQNNLHSLK